MAKALCFLIFAAFAWQAHGLALESVENAISNLFSDSNAAIDICRLPKDPGPCDAHFERYFFNHETGQCEQFVYGGCKGNRNNFKTKEDCEKRCLKVQGKEVCFLPYKVGKCRGAFPRYYFDKRDGKCKNFTYGGCDSNGNNFETIEECEKHCGDALSGHKHIPVCKQKKWPGPCKGHFERYYFNYQTKKCEKFIYGGCQRNGNNFADVEECTKRCLKTEESTVDVCQMPQDKGPCKGHFVSWWFNYSTKKCERFIYGGCKGNANRFGSTTECEARCLKKPGSTVDVCQLPQDKGPCKGHFVSWWFNSNTKKCEKFIYGGCQGNENRFSSRTACEARCAKKQGAEGLEDFECGKDGLYPNKRNCSSFIQCTNGRPVVMPCPKGLHFSTKTNRCEQVCKAFCDRTLACKCNWKTCGKQSCLQSAETGSCKAYKARYFFDKESGLCKPFTYSGCLGNENNFEKKVDCQKFCSNSINICNLPSETGNCRAKITRYFYNSKTKKCETFIWGGCGGTANNFATLAACQSKCRGKLAADFGCIQNGTYPDPDDCNQYIDCYTNGTNVYHRCPTGQHYSVSLKRCMPECEAFCEPSIACKCHWSNCKEGASSSEESSEDFAETILPHDCHSPPETGNCHAHKIRWNYDSKTGKCTTFIYGGCPGNGNNYLTKEECEKQCSKHPEGERVSSEDISSEEITDTVSLLPAVPKLCSLPVAPGNCSGSYEKYYFDSEEKECKVFNYTGCGGNFNSFWTKELCERTCKRAEISEESSEDAKPDCVSPPKTGKCHAHKERWYYNKKLGICKTFIYGGCEGNGNNYKTKAQCLKQCSKHSEEESSEKVYPEPECDSPPDAGRCYAKVDRWYYDKKQGKCLKFVYGGCPGNGNNYLTESQCIKHCSKHSEELECPESNGDFPYHLDCKKYIACKDGKPKLKNCPPKLAFDFLLRKCVPADEAACAR